MEKTYFINTSVTGAVCFMYQDGDSWYVFTDQDSANTEYKAYLAWVAEGNTATEWQPEA